MKSLTIASAACVAASPAVLAASPVLSDVLDASKIFPRAAVQKPSVIPMQDAITSHGCYSSSGNLTLRQPVPNMSSSSCSLACKSGGFWVAGLHGPQCFCGFAYPPEDTVVDDSKCDFPCPSYPLEACGGNTKPGYWSIYNTGINVQAPTYDAPASSSSSPPSSSTTDSASATSADAKSTSPPVSVVTETRVPIETSGVPKDSKAGPNIAGIAAGVVVGVLAAAALLGCAFYFYRRKRNAEIEEEHRRNAAVNAFISGSKPPGSSGSMSMTDSRLDPALANRRRSDGSIADNQDYSRRILRVTNA